jgi:uncharacterized repeat protein (TIGR03803 family)
MLMASLILSCLALSAAAQSIQPIYFFTNGPASPIAGLTVGPDGNFYGTTFSGGTVGNGTADAGFGGHGTVFQLTTNGTITLLASLDGFAAAGLTVGPDGNLYGGSLYGGANGKGTIFQVTTKGVLTTLHSFSALSQSGSLNPDGAYPETELTMGPDSNLYGTTSSGGSGGSGTVFRITTNGTFVTLHSFGWLYDNPNNYSTNLDGSFPSSLLLGPDGRLYGTTFAGGRGGSGTVFRIATNGALDTLYAFSAPVTNSGAYTNGDGGAPSGLTLAPDGGFYGSTYRGGSNGYGTVFQINTNGAITTVANFAPSNGIASSILTLGADGNFYGTTFRGGASDKGTIFRVSTDGTFTTLYSFSTPGSAEMTYTPSGLILGPDGKLYGTRFIGGTSDFGFVFQISSTGVFATVASFTTPHGLNPYNGLQLGSDGNLYGTTSFGGNSGEGTAFVITNGVLTTLGSFSATPSALTLRPDGHLCGITEFNGGSSSNGTVFEIASNGTITTLADFVFESQAGPGELTVGPDGSLYGTSYYGGSNYVGSVCKIGTNGAYTELTSFGSVPGANPMSGLTWGPEGNFYGTTELGGTGGTGTIFRVTTNGTLTSLYSFSPLVWLGRVNTNSDGANPGARLTLGPDGNFYGTTPLGGSNGRGVLFRITADGALTALASFDNNDAYPEVALTLGPDGNFYGVTESGGTSTNGVVFKATTNGIITPLTSLASSNGMQASALTLGSDGNFYGTTGKDGPGIGGAIYRLDLPPSVVTPPSNQTVAAGSNATFSITLFGTAPFAYQWLSNGAPIADGTNSTLTISSVTPSSAGNYQVVVSNSWGSTTSAVATLTLAIAPTIITQPASESLPIGGTASFSVGASGTPPLAYQWYFNTNTPMAGATNACLSFGPVQTNHAGNYQVIVASPYGSATSSAVSFSVLLQPNCYGISNSLGSVTLFLASTPGSTNRLWATTNLSLPPAQWQPISTNAADATGLFQFTDMNTGDSSAKFYILSSP